VPARIERILVAPHILSAKPGIHAVGVMANSSCDFSDLIWIGASVLFATEAKRYRPFTARVSRALGLVRFSR